MSRGSLGDVQDWNYNCVLKIILHYLLLFELFSNFPKGVWHKEHASMSSGVWFRSSFPAIANISVIDLGWLLSLLLKVAFLPWRTNGPVVSCDYSREEFHVLRKRLNATGQITCVCLAHERWTVSIFFIFFYNLKNNILYQVKITWKSDLVSSNETLVGI